MISGMVEETGGPREIHRPFAFELSHTIYSLSDWDLMVMRRGVLSVSEL